MSNVNTHHFPQGEILVVDDNKSDLKFLSSILRKAGYKVRPASDGELALRSVRARLPGLILLDINMPGLDGYEVCLRLKDAKDTRDIPVIFISVKTSPLDKVRAFGVGGVDYISKPFEPDEVLARVATHLALWKAQKETEEKNLQLQQEITERKRAEEALRLHVAMMDNVSEGIYLIGLDDLLIKWTNEKFARMFGYDPEEMVGKQVDIVNAPTERPPADTRTSIVDVLKETGEWHGEVRNIKRDGTHFWCSANVSLFDHPKYGKVIVSVHTDITERKRAEKELQESEQNFRDLVEDLLDGIAIADENGYHIYVNPRFAEITGYSVDELLNMTGWDFTRPEDVEKFKQRMKERMAGEPHKRKYERVIIRKDGTEVLTEMSTTTTVWQGKKRPMAIIRDITERKRAEEALRESEERFRVMFESSHDLLTVADENAKTILANPAWCEALGYTPETQGDPIEKIHPDDRTRVIEAWRAMGRGESDFTNVELEYRYRTASGDYISLQTTMRKALVAGKPTMYVVAHDITERKRAEDALRRSLEETAHGQRTLLALSRAAQTVQRARTPDEVYKSIGNEIAALGYHATIFALTDDGKRLAAHHVIFESKVLRAAEKLIGLSAKDYSFPLAADGFYRRILSGGEAVFSDPAAEAIVEALPAPMRPLAAQLAATLGLGQAVYVPLKIGGKPYGLLTVVGADLTEADVPAVAIFANQATIAVENARLLETVTEHRRDLQRLSAQIIGAQEAERQRISQELHDEMGQALTAMSINLAAIEKELPPELDPVVRERLAETSSLADQTLEQVRELALDLRPAMLDDLGLVPAVRWYVNRFAKRLDLEVELEAIDLDERLAPEVETALYRVVQEALTNVARHAQANRVRLRLERKPSTVVAVIEDDGIGFDVAEPAGQVLERGVGLVGAQERVAFLGGSLSIQSRPGQGTRLSVKVPLRRRGGS